MLLAHLLIALGAVIVAGRLLARLLRRLGQPPVIGEVLAGILLGPSLLGWMWPDAYAFVLPEALRPTLGVVAHVGVVLYMFLVGVELNPARLREQVRATALTSLASIIVPFAMGLALASYLFAAYAPAGVPFTSFAPFIGVAMCVTAFPVLARILSELRMSRTRLGLTALAAAAMADIAAWLLLAFVVGADDSPAQTAVRVSIVGAFLIGVLVPHDGRVAAMLHRTVDRPVTIVLLPAFFAFTGMRTELGLLATAEDWLVCGLIVLVASAGKIGGTFAAARLTGFGARDATTLGVLMNTRGLMELIVLNVGLELGILTPLLFTMLVGMAIVTTVATSPLVLALNHKIK